MQGRVSFSNGGSPPPVSLYSYRLTGRVVDSAGKPVAGAIVTTRTLDRDYWTLSDPTDKNGDYTSFFTASAEESTDPQVPFAIAWPRQGLLLVPVQHEHRLPAVAQRPARPQADDAGSAAPEGRRSGRAEGRDLPGRLVGAVAGSRPVMPLAGTWPDRKGYFSLVLPRSLAGKIVTFYEAAPRASRPSSRSPATRPIAAPGRRSSARRLPAASGASGSRRFRCSAR